MFRRRISPPHSKGAVPVAFIHMSAEIPGSGDIYFAQPLIHGLSHERVPALPEFYGQPVPQFRHMAACGRGPERRSVLNESVPDA